VVAAVKVTQTRAIFADAVSIDVLVSLVSEMEKLYSGTFCFWKDKYPQEHAQDAVCQSHTGPMTGLWFLPDRPLRLNTNE